MIINMKCENIFMQFLQTFPHTYNLNKETAKNVWADRNPNYDKEEEYERSNLGYLES